MIRTRFAATAAAGALFLVACGSSASGAASASPSPAAPGELAASRCDKSVGLTVYSAQGYDSDATKAFQAQTGIQTKLLDDSTGPLLAKIAAEGSNPQWDVIWVDGNVTLQDLDNRGGFNLHGAEP